MRGAPFERFVSSNRLRLVGTDAVTIVEAPLAGVLRVRFAPRARQTSALFPELTAKTSFACIDRARVPLRVDGDVIEAEGVRATLDGRFVFEGHALDVEGDFTPGFPLDRHRTRLRIDALEGEGYFGFGEKVGPLDKRGMRFTFWNTDAYPPEPHTDPLYASIPFFIAVGVDGRAWGLFLDETTRAHVDVAAKDRDRLVWDIEGPEADVYLMTGPTPAEVLARYVALTGRPFVPPLFALGQQQSRWGYMTADHVRSVVQNYRAHDLPLDVVYLDIDHMDAYRPFSWHPVRFADPKKLIADLGEHGVRVIPIVDPAVPADDREAREKGYVVELDRGKALVGEVWPDPAVWPDFTRPEVQRFWADRHQADVELGIAGVWNDMNEPSCFSIAESRGLPAGKGERLPGASKAVGSTLPDEAWHGDRRHLEVHNAYALGMARAAFEGLARHAPKRRPFVLTRAGSAGIQRYAAMWTGDFRSHWTHLDATLPLLLGLGISGVPFVGSDVPGFAGDGDGELLVRWTQAAVFAPLLRNHSARGTLPQEPWAFGEPWLSLTRAALALRYRLLPALYTALVEAHETGAPPLRPLFFDHPADREARVTTDEAMFAGALLVAPIARPGQTKRLAYLPRGRWRPLGPDLADAGPIAEGPAHVVADAPLDRVPMWLAEGAGFAATEPALHTTTAEWPSLTWHLFPRADGTAEARLYEDAGDGPVDGTWTRVTASAGRITRTGAPRGHRERERVVLHGDVTLTRDVAPDWTTLEL